jgi:hypothetical protein
LPNWEDDGIEETNNLGGCIGGAGTCPKTKSSYEQMEGRWN